MWNNQTAPEYVEGIYDDYMQVVRYLVSEPDEVDFSKDDDKPTGKQVAWANRASLGNTELAHTLSLLARVTELAFKQRYLEGMPMLVDLDTAAGNESNDFSSSERLHFIRRVIHDSKLLESSGEIPGVPPVLYMTPVA